MEQNDRNIIKIACKTETYAQLDDLMDLQGELKTLSEENRMKLMTEIKTTGFAFAVHAWKDKKGKLHIVDGHQRVAALKELNRLKYKIPKVPVVLVEAKSLHEAKRRVLQGVSQYGEVNSEGLFTFIQGEFDIKDIATSFEMPNIDFPSFVQEHFREPPKGSIDGGDEDKIPEVVQLVVKGGDIWKLGAHRLICGDATDLEDINNLTLGEKPDMVFTDPPYNVGKDYGMTTDDTKTEEEYKEWSLTWFRNMPTDFIVFTPGIVNVKMWYRNTDPKWMCSWRKVNANCSSALGGFNTWEPFLVYGKPIRRLGHDSWDHIIHNQDKAEIGDHPVPKQIDIWTEILEAFSTEGASVFDPFGGSGSTLIACEKTKKKCFMMEISPKYCQIILQRWATFTGEDPVREDGVKFSDLLKK